MSTISALDFSGRRVLVTGGGKGIGKAIALKFNELNATVIVIDKDEQLLNELKKEYPSIQTVVVDLGDWDATREAVKSVLPIHHLANNAAIAPVMNFLEIDSKHIDDTFNINYKAALNVAQVVAKGMIEHGIQNGSIVNTSSVADSVVHSGITMYSTMKAALTMLTRNMAVELAPHGIRVNCVRPALVRTEMVANLPQDYKNKNFKPILERMLFHDYIEPEEIANTFAFLSSPLAKCITGVALSTDQGFSVQ